MAHCLLYSSDSTRKRFNGSAGDYPLLLTDWNKQIDTLSREVGMNVIYRQTTTAASPFFDSNNK